MAESCYENLRTVLTLNLCSVVQDPEALKIIMEKIDMTMNDYDVRRKEMGIISVGGFPDVAKYYLASKAVSNLSKNTLKQYRYKLTHFFDTVRKSFADITANDIRIYLFNFKQERNVSDCYVDNVRITLNTFFQWLVDNDYLQKNPCKKVDKIKYQEKRREPLSTYSLETLRWNCLTVREKALVDFLYSTGCRISECAGVLLSDINWDNNSVLLRYCKGDKERTVFFNDEAKVSLKKYLEEKEYISTALWTSTRSPHQQLKPHALENVISGIGKRIGLHTYPHKLRHTFASVGIQSGMPLEVIQALLGHAKPETTLIYAKNDDRKIHMDHRKVFN